MNKVGYLSSTGKFFDCLTYGHLELARKICLRLYNMEFDNRINAELHLLLNGWVMFQDNDVSFQFKQENRWRFLTKYQKYFLMDELKICTNESKISSIKAILNMNDILNNTRLE